MPSLSSFVNSSQYSTERITVPFVAGMLAGSTYNTGITFTGYSGAVATDPGGLFGWLIYARTAFTPVAGSTASSYVVYTTPQDLVGDLNKLSGVTYALMADNAAGSTYSLFLNAGNLNGVSTVTAQPIGTDFLMAINYLAYGGSLVISGTTVGLGQYVNDSGAPFDVVFGKEATSSLAQWLINQIYTIGIFPSAADAAGVTGNGTTMANYASLFGNSQYVSGTTVANRVFNVYGLKTVSSADSSTLLAGSKITYNIPAVADVGGAFIRAKNRNETYLTVAGLARSSVLNGDITNSVDWNSSLKNTLRDNRVNFYVNYNPKFLGSDLTGATSSGTFTNNDRIGPAKMRTAITQIVNKIGLKYLYAINNASTRNLVVSEIQTSLDPFTPYLDPTQTQIICSNANNQDYSTTLKISVVIKPILSIDTLVIDVNLTQ